MCDLVLCNNDVLQTYTKIAIACLVINHLRDKVDVANHRTIGGTAMGTTTSSGDGVLLGVKWTSRDK